MDYHYFKSKLNNFFARYVGYKKRPTFFDINQICPALNNITDNYEVIRQEFENIKTNTPNLPRYHDIDPGEAEISTACEKKWNVFMAKLPVMGTNCDWYYLPSQHYDGKNSHPRFWFAIHTTHRASCT